MSTRTDCTRDNHKTLLPKASTLGFGLCYAKRGNWIQFRHQGRDLVCGRVIGRVHCEGETYIEVIAVLGAFTIPAVRWIKPEDVTECRQGPPTEIFRFIGGEWESPETILAAVHNGFLPDFYTEAKESGSC
jgi:hypothetical protein